MNYALTLAGYQWILVLPYQFIFVEERKGEEVKGKKVP